MLQAKALQSLYTVRSERLRYDLRFQWFLDMNPSEPTFDVNSFSTLSGAVIDGSRRTK